MPTSPPLPPAPPKALTFAELWKHYPGSDPCVNPQTGMKAYDDQCAIRLSMAPERSGVSFKTLQGSRCEFGPRGNGMVLRAEMLIQWLLTRPFAGCPAPISRPGKDFQQRIQGHTGIFAPKPARREPCEVDWACDDLAGRSQDVQTQGRRHDAGNSVAHEGPVTRDQTLALAVHRDS